MSTQEIKEILNEIKAAKQLIVNLEEKVSDLLLRELEKDNTPSPSSSTTLAKEKQKLLLTDLTLNGLECFVLAYEHEQEEEREVKVRLDRRSGIIRISPILNSFMSMFANHRNSKIPEKFSIECVKIVYPGGPNSRESSNNTIEEEEVTFSMNLILPGRNAFETEDLKLGFRCKSIIERDKILMNLIIFMEEWKSKYPDGAPEDLINGNYSNNNELSPGGNSSESSSGVISPNKDIGYDNIFESTSYDRNSSLMSSNTTMDILHNDDYNDYDPDSPISGLTFEEANTNRLSLQVMSNPLVKNNARMSAKNNQGEMSDMAKKMLSLQSPAGQTIK